MEPFRINKLEAVSRQLETAIRLFFSKGDPVAIHTLSHASYIILRDICRNNGKGLPMIEMLIAKVLPVKQKEVRAKFNEAANFFKHADTDHSGQLEFRPALTEWMLQDCSKVFQGLTGQNTPWLFAMQLWMTIRNPGIWSEEIEQNMQVLRDNSELATMPREEFMREIESLWARGVGQ